MQPINWDNIHHFLEVVRSGSVITASQHMSVNQTTVSRHISTLETQLGIKLFERSANNWLITPLGEKIITFAENMADEIVSIERHVMADSQELRGKLRLTVGDICTQQLAMPAINAFIKQYPEIELEIIATRNDLNLTTREADIALRSTNSPSENLLGKRITKIAYNIYGNKKIADQIKSKKNEIDTPCITWLGDGISCPPWIEKSFPRTQRIYRTTELNIMQNMVKQGLGIAQLPCALCDLDPELHRIPAEFIEPGWDLWVLSHVDLRTTARVRIFKHFLISELEKQIDLIEGKCINRDT